MSPFDFALPDLAALSALAEKIAPQLRKRDVLALHGNLGSGKTEFARALLRKMGVTCDVPSPTFTLLQTYELKGLQIFHFDLYRLKSPDELDELGWDDALADGITLVEWPERAGSRLPKECSTFHFSLASGSDRRCLVSLLNAVT